MGSRLKPMSVAGGTGLVPVEALRSVAEDVELVVRAMFNQQDSEESVGAAERLSEDIRPLLPAQVVLEFLAEFPDRSVGEMSFQTGMDGGRIERALDCLGDLVAEVEPGLWRVVE